MSSPRFLRPVSLLRLAAFAIGTALAACATTAPPPPADLVTARVAYDHVSTGGTANLAPAEIRAAREQLEAAESAYDREGDSETTRAQAYIARRKAEYADEVIRTRQATHATSGQTP